MTAKIYHNARCSKSRAALNFLTLRGIEPTIITYLDTPPTVEEMRNLQDRAGLHPHDAIRTGEPEYNELGLSSDTPDDELLAAMVSHPRLIERPIVETDKGVRIARPTEVLEEII